MSDLDQARKTINEIDQEMARLFEKRMNAVRTVVKYKKSHGLPVEDLLREADLVRVNAALIENEDYRSYYVDFLRHTMELSKRMQYCLMDEL